MENTNEPKAKNTGNPSSPKTNQDFNKKPLKPGDPELDIKPDDIDLPKKNSADVENPMLNTKPINKEDIDKKDDEGNIDAGRDSKTSDGFDEHVSREDNIKNPNAREI